MDVHDNMNNLFFVAGFERLNIFNKVEPAILTSPNKLEPLMVDIIFPLMSWNHGKDN